jgi:hypothetical protein
MNPAFALTVRCHTASSSRSSSATDDFLFVTLAPFRWAAIFPFKVSARPERRKVRFVSALYGADKSGQMLRSSLFYLCISERISSPVPRSCPFSDYP